MKILLADPNLKSVQKLELLLLRFYGNRHNVYRGENLKEFRLYLKYSQIDLVIIDLAWENDYEIARLCKELQGFPHILPVYMSSKTHHKSLQKNLKKGAFDILYKPVAEKDILDVIQRVEGRLNSSLSPLTDRLSLAIKGGILLIDPINIVRVEASGSYSIFRFSNRPKLIVSKRLGVYEDILSPDQFVRVHHSHLININYVDKYMRSGGGYVILKDQERISVSAGRKHYLEQYLGRFLQ